MTATSQQAMPGDPDLVPQVVASYARYLHARTRAVPQATVTASHAQLSLAIGDKTLVLAFGYRGRDWSLRSAEVRSGELATTFTRGKLAQAVTTLLQP